MKTFARRSLAAPEIFRRVLFAASTLERACYAKSIKLDAASASNDGEGKAKWIQVAEEGNFLGHKQGNFNLNAQVFANLVANFHAHPSYVADMNGVGCARVVAFDWRHASEMPPENIEREAAQGWAWDLELRMNGAVAQLWALAEMLEPAKTLIREGKIQWTSVAIWPDATDPRTNANIGWYLSSIALTNDPFIQGMVPIAATREGAPITAAGTMSTTSEGPKLASYYFDPYDKPKNAGEVVERLRRLFGLPEMADLAQVISEIAKLRAAALGQMQAPAGVNILELVGALRCIFNLPTMSTVEAVFDEADTLLERIAEQHIEEEIVEHAGTGDPISVRPMNLIPADRNSAQKENVNMKELERLAIMLGLTANTDEAGIQRAIIALQRGKQEGEEFEALFLDAVGAKGDPGKGKGKGSVEGIKKVLGALGAANPDEAMSKIAETFATCKTLSEAMPGLEAELAEMYSDMGDEDEEDVGGDVEAAMTAQRINPREPNNIGLVNIMCESRTGGPRGEVFKKGELNAKLLATRDPKDATKGAVERVAILKDAKERLTVRLAARKGFHEKHLAKLEPRNEGPMGGPSLFSRYIAPEPMNRQSGAMAGAYGFGAPPPQFQPPPAQGGFGGPAQFGNGGHAPPPNDGGSTIDLNRFCGYQGNLTEKAIKYLCSIDPSMAKASARDQFHAARRIKTAAVKQAQEQGVQIPE